MNINVGDYVKKGQVLAIIDQAELQSQLQQQRAKLAQLESQNYSSNLLQGQRKLEEKRAIAQQRLQQAISLTPILRNRGLSSLQVQQQNLLQSRAIAVSMISPQRKIYEGLQKRIIVLTIVIYEGDCIYCFSALCNHQSYLLFLFFFLIILSP
ncbi:MAG: biotin/lipoyl-binding protein [Nostoc sp. DedSLP03]|uniref:biotin/lipoyl-binding protein n=1 Tax=Nostoc sp. DedSLP03 TaxID=3075400 RepID=UPI002AD24C39|nr:biotin/lipoyl-binding protein [Nostoc sp. DedSLP03]MDZ7968783.1 biotin/lipoyl-binding protein [Nostoc sp. DedSLP03]